MEHSGMKRYRIEWNEITLFGFKEMEGLDWNLVGSIPTLSIKSLHFASPNWDVWDGIVHSSY